MLTIPLYYCSTIAEIEILSQNWIFIFNLLYNPKTISVAEVCIAVVMFDVILLYQFQFQSNPVLPVGLVCLKISYTLVSWPSLNFFSVT
jgi:hypothetical protein